MIAPVLGSGDWPAWIDRVPSPSALDLSFEIIKLSPNFASENRRQPRIIHLCYARFVRRSGLEAIAEHLIQAVAGIAARSVLRMTQ
jgi:hypothetical protein